MPVELLVILGAEASILGFVVAMSLRARRMDVLSGRSFEHPIVSPAGNEHPARSSHRRARDLLQLIGRTISSRSFHPISSGPLMTSMLRPILQTRSQTPARVETGPSRTGRPTPFARDRPAEPSGPGRNTDAQGKGAGPEHMQSSAAAILHQLNAP